MKVCPANVFLLFAMNRHYVLDVQRTSILSKHGLCITFSEGQAIQGVGEHVEVDFKLERGWNRVLEFIANLLPKLEPSAHVVAFLDYFWLQTNYFAERYGIDWYSRKVPSLLLAGVERCYLPHASEIAHTLKEVPPNTRFSFVHSTPLFRASIAVVVCNQRGTETHTSHLARLAFPPFIEFTHGITLSTTQAGTPKKAPRTLHRWHERVLEAVNKKNPEQLLPSSKYIRKPNLFWTLNKKRSGYRLWLWDEDVGKEAAAAEDVDGETPETAVLKNPKTASETVSTDELKIMPQKKFQLKKVNLLKLPDTSKGGARCTYAVLLVNEAKDYCAVDLEGQESVWSTGWIKSFCDMVQCKEQHMPQVTGWRKTFASHFGQSGLFGKKPIMPLGLAMRKGQVTDNVSYISKHVFKFLVHPEEFDSKDRWRGFAEAVQSLRQNAGVELNDKTNQGIHS